MGHGKLQDPVEQHPSAARAAAVEPEHELVQVAGQVRRIHRSLVGAQQPSFCKGRYSVRTWQKLSWIFTSCQCGPLATAVMDVPALLQSAVALPSIGDDRRPRFDVGQHEGDKRL